jgi:hypothetical protein
VPALTPRRIADVAKQVDARDLKSLDFGHTGSTPVVRTKAILQTSPDWSHTPNLQAGSPYMLIKLFHRLVLSSFVAH